MGVLSRRPQVGGRDHEVGASEAAPRYRVGDFRSAESQECRILDAIRAEMLVGREGGTLLSKMVHFCE